MLLLHLSTRSARRVAVHANKRANMLAQLVKLLGRAVYKRKQDLERRVVRRRRCCYCCRGRAARCLIAYVDVGVEWLTRLRRRRRRRRLCDDLDFEAHVAC